MNNNIITINKKYLNGINKTQKIISKKTLTKIDDIRFIDEALFISYKNRTVKHLQNETGKVYCKYIIENGNIKMIENTNKPYIDTLFQDNCQEELQILYNLNKAYFKNIEASNSPKKTLIKKQKN